MQHTSYRFSKHNSLRETENICTFLRMLMKIENLSLRHQQQLPVSCSMHLRKENLIRLSVRLLRLLTKKISLRIVCAEITKYSRTFFGACTNILARKSSHTFTATVSVATNTISTHYSTNQNSPQTRAARRYPRGPTHAYR